MLWSTFPSSKGIRAWVSWSSRYCGWVLLFEVDGPPPASHPPSLFNLFGEADDILANGLDGLFFSRPPPLYPPPPDFTELSGVSSCGVLPPLSITLSIIVDRLPMNFFEWKPRFEDLPARRRRAVSLPFLTRSHLSCWRGTQIK